MDSPNCHQEANEYSSQANNLENALECKSLQELLCGEAGAFTFRYWFINEYINYLNVIGSQGSIDSDNKSPENKNTFTNFIGFVSNIIDFVKLISRKRKDNPAELLFISRNRKAKIRTRDGYVEGDYVFYSVMNELKKRHPYMNIAMYLIDDTNKKYEYATPFDILQSVYFALEKFLLWSSRRKYLLNCFKGDEYGYVGQFANSFFHFRSLLRNALLGNSIKKMIESHRPRVIISNDDCLYTKPLMNKNIKNIVLQSASVVKSIEDCRGLIFQETKLKPDIFLCSGKESGEIKENAKIAKKIAVTGQPRYDILFNPQELYCKDDFRKRHAIKMGQRIVLWATQTHGLGNDENIKNLRAVFGACQDLKDVTLLIKQHPAETKVHTKLINDFLNRYSINAILTPKDSDTYEQLFVCDIMITKHSTTAIEAIALKKPVIILNLSRKTDLVDYVCKQVATGVYDEKDLKDTIEKLLLEESQQEKNRDTYLEDHLSTIDGKATDRVVDVIVQMIDS